MKPLNRIRQFEIDRSANKNVLEFSEYAGKVICAYIFLTERPLPIQLLQPTLRYFRESRISPDATANFLSGPKGQELLSKLV